MEQLTAALLSCPIPASYALGSGDRDSGKSECRSLPRLRAAASLAALEGISPSAAADAASAASSERTPEMLQERGGRVSSASEPEGLAGSSPTADLLLLQAASKAAAADAAAANHTTGLLLPPGGGSQQQRQRRLELMRKALHAHRISSATDVSYASSSSASLRSVSTHASSLPEEASSSSQRAMVHHLSSSSAEAGCHSFPAAASVASSQCSPFSSPSSSASPADSTPPPAVPLPSQATTSNDFASRCVIRPRSPFKAAEAAAVQLLKGADRRQSPAEAMAQLCSAAGAFSVENRDALAAAAAAVTAAVAGDVAVGVHQQRQLSQTAVHGHELPFGAAEGTQSPPAEAGAGGVPAAAEAVDVAANTPAVEASTTIAAAAAAEGLASELADTSAITANDSSAAAEKVSEAAACAVLAAGGVRPEEAAAGRTQAGASSPHRGCHQAAEQAEKGSRQQSEIGEAARRSRRGGDSGVKLQQDVSSEACPFLGEKEVGVKDDTAGLPSGADVDLRQTAAAFSNPPAARAAVAAATGGELAAVLRNSSTAATAGGGCSAATAGAARACDDTTGGEEVAMCSGGVPFDLPSVGAVAAAVDSRHEAGAAADTRAERTIRKKRLRECAGAKSRRGVAYAAAAAAAVPTAEAASAGAAADRRVVTAPDLKLAAAASPAAAATASSCEEAQTQKDEDGSGGEKFFSGAAAHTGEVSEEKSHTLRKKEKRCTAAGGAAGAAISEADLQLDAYSGSAAGEMHEEGQTALPTAAGELCVSGDPLLQDNAAAVQTAASNNEVEGGGSRGGAAGSSLEREDTAASAAGAAAAADSSTSAAARMVGDEEVISAAAGALVGKKTHTHEGEGKRVNSLTETGEAFKEESQQSEACDTCLPEQVEYLAATSYFSGGAAEEGAGGNTRGCAERSEQECSTMSCNSRNSSGEQLLLSSALSVDSVEHEESLLQDFHGKENEKNKRKGEVTTDNTCRELAMALGIVEGVAAGAGGYPATATTGEEEVSGATNSRNPEEDSQAPFGEHSSFVGEKTAAAEGQAERLGEDERAASVQQELGQEGCGTLQRQQHEEREANEHQQEQEPQQREEQQQQDEEEEEGLMQEAGSCFVGGAADSGSASWEMMEDSSSVPPLHAYKALSWTEGFSLPLGKIGRQKLLRQVRLKYHRNREHWRAKLHEKGFDVTSLPRMGVEQLWAVAQQMDLFDVACIIAHEHATRRQHRGGGGGVYGGAVAGHHQQQHAPGACGGGEGADAAAPAAKRGAGDRGGGEEDVVAASALLGDATACTESTLGHLPSLVNPGGAASLRDVCAADQALKSALALLADNAAAPAGVPYACSSAQQTDQGERRSGHQRSRGGGAVKEIPLLHTISRSNSIIPHGSSSSPQDRSSTRTRYRAKAEESRHAAAASGKVAAQKRRDAAAEAASAATAAAAEEEEAGEEGGEGGGSREEVYAATLAGAGTEPTEEEDEEVGTGDHPLLLLQEDDGANGGGQEVQDLKESALLLLQQQAQRDELFAEEASTREEDGEGGRALLGEPEHSVRGDQEGVAGALAAAAAAAAAAERRRTCGLFHTDGGVELAGEAATAADSTASGWPSRGAGRRNKKKMRQEQPPPCGNDVGELLSKVCAEALREAVACATNVAAGGRYSLQTASSSACLRALGLADAAGADASGGGADGARAIDVAAAAAVKEAAGVSEAGAAAATEAETDETSNCEAVGQQLAAAAASCSSFLGGSWSEAEARVWARTTQRQEELQQQRQRRHMDASLLERVSGSGVGEGEICGSGSTVDLVRLCAAAASQRGEEGKIESFYSDGCRSFAEGFGASEADELALFLQQQFGASSSSGAVSGRALCASGELFNSESGKGAATSVVAEICKEGKEGGKGLALERQGEQTYDGSAINGSEAAPPRAGKGRQQGHHREKQRGERDRHRSLVDRRQVRLKDIQEEKQRDETGDVSRETPESGRAEAPGDAFAAAGDAAAILGSSRLTAGPSLAVARFGAASTPLETAAHSASEPASLAAAVGDLLWMTRGVVGEEVKREQRSENLASYSLDREMLDEAAAALNEEERERKEAQELAETRRCMRDALSEIYMHLNNGLRGAMSAAPRAVSKESSQKDGAAEGDPCCHLSAEAGTRPANATRAAAAAFAAGAGSATQEARMPAAPVDEAKTCTGSRSARRTNTHPERDWGARVFRREGGGGGSSSIDRSPCSGGSSNSYGHVVNTAHRSGEGGVKEDLCKGKARARGCFDAQLAERLQQRVNDLQGQLDEVKVQLHELLKLSNGAAEAFSATVPADEATQHVSAAEDSASADSEPCLSVNAGDGRYCSR